MKQIAQQVGEQFGIAGSFFLFQKLFSSMSYYDLVCQTTLDHLRKSWNYT